MPRSAVLSCAVLAIAATLAACSGVPLRSMPRLMSLPGTLLDLDPAQFMLAIQVDARMAPPPDAAPVMRVHLRPREAGAFEALQKDLPMRFATASGSEAAAQGLPPARAQRRWLLYRFAPEAQAELARLQQSIRHLRAGGGPGGSVAIGIAQEGVAARDPVFADTRWETWLQTSTREGFYEVWSGTVAELLQQAMEARRQP